jgi:zinc protease
MYVSARQGRTGDEIERVVARELARVRDEPVTDEELAGAKARLELALLQGLDTASGKAEQIGFYETVLGDPAAAFRRLEAYRRATAGELRRVARRYLTDEERTVVRVLPEEAAQEPAAEAAS